jgi:hypothetical protein
MKPCWTLFHRPISHYHPPGTPSKNVSQVVGLFREPNSRIISAFLDSKHHEGMPEDIFKKGMENSIHSKNISLMFSDYLSMRGMRGCQMKMLLGYYCSEDIDLNQEMILNATAILREMKFVGITERYNQSVIAFHHIMGGTLPHPIEFQNYRVMNGQHHHETMLRKVISQIGYFDEYDTMIYQEAWRLFDLTWQQTRATSTSPSEETQRGRGRIGGRRSIYIGQGAVLAQDFDDH